MNTNIKPLVLAVLVASSFSIISCSKGQAPDEYAEISVTESKEKVATEDNVSSPPLTNMVMEDGEAEKGKESAIAEEKSASHQLESKAVNQQVADKKFVVNASAEFTVTDVVDSVNTIEELTKKNQGFIEFSHIDNNLISTKDVVRSDVIIRLSRYVRTAQMTVRIPKDNVSEFLKQLQKQVKFLQASEFSAKDVTLDIYREQLESQISGEQVEELEEQRLNAKKAKEQTSNVDTINKTYEAKTKQALAKLEKKAIEDKIKYSTIQLSFSQPENIYQKTLTNTQKLVNNYQPNFQVQLQDSVQSGWLSFKEIILELAKGWWIALLIILSVPAWQVLRLFWRITARILSPKKETKKPVNKLKQQAEKKPLVQENKTIEPTKTTVEPAKTENVPMPPPLPKEAEKQTSDSANKEDKKDS